MHATGTLRLGCTDCHGGNADARVASGVATASPEYEQVKRKAHPQPRDPKLADRSANPERLYTQWLKESPEYVRFVNPGDLRVAPETCGRAGCHPSEVRNVSTSMMTTGGMLWGAALYNNGGYPHKDTRFGESYSRDGAPQTVRTIPAAFRRRNANKGHPAGDHAARTLGNFAARQRLARVRTRRRPERRGRRARRAPMTQENPTTSSARADSARCFAPIRFFLDCKRLACSIPCFPCRAPTISRATIAPADARRATSCMRTTVPPSIPRSTLRSAIAATARRKTRRFRAKSPATPSATNLRARSRRASAWSAMCIRARTW